MKVSKDLRALWDKFRPFVFGGIGGAAGLLMLPWTGVMDFAANSGNWEIEDWYHYLSVRQSVALRSAGTEVPPLDDPAMVQRGAGHYEMVCAQCHGSPAGEPAQLQELLPPTPPLLMEQMDNWRPPARVFWTVLHGIKGTAMPSWPTQEREDEVWDMVAFLDVMSGMEAEEYRGLIGGDAGGTCAGCHGADGNSIGPAFPRLDIQTPQYLDGALRAFRDRRRESGTMQWAAHRLSDGQIAGLASHFGRQVAAEPAGGAGAEIAQRGIPDRDVPACDSCHNGKRADYPRLAGQSKDYILNQLEVFAKLGEKRGGPHAAIMAEVARALTPEQMEAAAAYYGRE